MTFELNTQVKFSPASDDLSSFGVSKAAYSATLAHLLESIGGFSFTHGLTYQPRLDKLETTYLLSYYGLKLKDKTVTLSLYFYTTNQTKTDGYMDVIKKETISVPLSLPLDFTFTPKLVFTTVYAPNGEKEIKNWTSEKNVTLSATLSLSNINKDIDGNQDFRKGVSFSLLGSRTTPIADLLQEKSQYGTLSFSWFPIATSWINPSLRITGIISKIATRDLFDDYYDTDSTTMAEYLRGIRNDNPYNLKAWNVMAIANLNITTKCINLGSWAHTYASPFVDVAYLSDDVSCTQGHWLYTVGIEGIGIINDHSNYPVRASLGFNGESLKTYFETKNFEDLEYEIFFGLGFFY